AVDALATDYADRAIELKEVGSGFRIQVRGTVALWVQRLWEERPTRYSRALLETLALIAYRQPVTRGDIEDLRGVSVSPNIMRTLQERDWIRVVGEREAPGRPALYGTTRAFLDYFGLRALDQLPPLPEIRALLETTVEGGASAAASEPAVSEPAVSEPAVSGPAVSGPAAVDADPIGEDEDTSPGDTTSNAGPAEAGRAEGGTAGGAQ
ncbi:MAG: SMC-Scp complex subunit ScpB, partial [Gammaproteobacteria bacterium]